MKPITDDVVYSLMQGIEAREKPNAKRRQTLGGSAKIIRFTGASDRGDVAALNAKRSRRTMAGVFLYVSKMSSV